MNCRQFEDKVLDLARGIDREDPVRNQALEHAGGCSRCSTLLANQQALNSVIKLAAAERSQAPEHIEAALISAFRRRRAGYSRKVTPFPARMAWSARSLGIAAAVLVTILGIAALRMLRTSQPGETRISGPVLQESLPGTAQSKATDPAPDQPSTVQEPTQLAAEAKPAAKAMSRPPAEKAAPEIVEIATDFFALTPGVDLDSMESGQLVRVRLPRSAMASYGLPVNQERLDKPVTAQVLIGQDGVARAIRFLSEQNANFVPTGMQSKR